LVLGALWKTRYFWFAAAAAFRPVHLQALNPTSTSDKTN